MKKKLDLDKLFPEFREYMLKKYLSTGMNLASLKEWYKFLEEK